MRLKGRPSIYTSGNPATSTLKRMPSHEKRLVSFASCMGGLTRCRCRGGS